MLVGLQASGRNGYCPWCGRMHARKALGPGVLGARRRSHQAGARERMCRTGQDTYRTLTRREYQGDRAQGSVVRSGRMGEQRLCLRSSAKYRV